MNLINISKRNEYIFEGDICKIIINSPKHGIKYVIIDFKNYKLVKKYTWHLRYHKHIGGFYVMTNVRDESKKSKQSTLRLHRLITNCPSGLVVDHINCDTLNNIESNLRVCTNKQNSENRGKPITNKSGYRNVSWDKQHNKI